MTDALVRPLAGFAVGISISDSEEAARLGFPAGQINHVSTRLATALLGQGASLVFGHDWRPGGIMDAIYAVALAIQSPGDSIGYRKSRPVLSNFLAWPDRTALSDDQKENISGTLSIEDEILPAELSPGPFRSRAPDNYVRARALTQMRRTLISKSKARVCFGGRINGSKGRYPGVIEETYLSIESGQPVYLSGLLGGASRIVIDAIMHRASPPPISLRSPLDDVYSSLSSRSNMGQDAEIDRGRVWSLFNTIGVGGLSNANHLSEDQNKELFETQSVERAIQLVLLGVSKAKGVALGP